MPHTAAAVVASQNQNKNHTDQHQNHRIIPGGVVPTFFDSIKSGFGRSLFGGSTATTVAKKELTEFERCLAEHRDDLAYCAQFAEKK